MPYPKLLVEVNTDKYAPLAERKSKIKCPIALAIADADKEGNFTHIVVDRPPGGKHTARLSSRPDGMRYEFSLPDKAETYLEIWDGGGEPESVSFWLDHRLLNRAYKRASGNKRNVQKIVTSKGTKAEVKVEVKPKPKVRRGYRRSYFGD